MSFILSNDSHVILKLTTRDIVKQILKFLRSPSQEIRRLALKVVGNISYSSNSKMLLDLDALDYINEFSGEPKACIKKEICYIISNFVGENKWNTHKVISHSVINKPIKALYSQDDEILREASWVFSNISKTAQDDDILSLIDKNILNVISEAITTSNSDVVLNLLNFIKRALDVGKKIGKNNMTNVNKICELFDASDCLIALENLLGFPKLSVFNFANEIIEEYFEFEEEEKIETSEVPSKFNFS